MIDGLASLNSELGLIEMTQSTHDLARFMYPIFEALGGSYRGIVRTRSIHVGKLHLIERALLARFKKGEPGPTRCRPDRNGNEQRQCNWNWICLCYSHE